jgi:hypothetical protein
MGAATHGLKTQRFIATVPIKVAMDAPCTIILVKQALPFEMLGASPSEVGSYSDSDADTDARAAQVHTSSLEPASQMDLRPRAIPASGDNGP